MVKVLDKLVAVVSLCAMLGLCGAYLAAYINPNLFVLPSLLGLAYPYFLIGNIVLLLYWTIRWKKAALLLLMVILAGIPAFTTYYGTAGKQIPSSSYDLSLLSYNVRYFDIYNWSGQKNTQEKLFAYLNDFEGDILCLQEVFIHEKLLKRQSIIRNLKSYPYHYLEKDMAIFSRIPFIGHGSLTFEPSYSGSCIYCDLKVKNDTVRIYSVHLESYKMGKNERKFLKEITTGLQSDDLPQGIKNITTRLTTANKIRASQVKKIKAAVNRSPYKVILCGDFNDTPLSYTYHQLQQGLEDSFIQKGHGLGNTYIGEFPSFRIDYLLHSSDLATISYTRDNVHLSDHYPIHSKLKIKK